MGPLAGVRVIELGGIGPGNSPYMSPSAFAGNELFIDLERLLAAGWLRPSELEPRPDFSAHQIDYAALRAYRLYLAGCAMGFERGWVALHQMLCARPSGDVHGTAMVGAQSGYPFNREYMYR